MSATRVKMNRLQELIRLYREGASGRRRARLLRMGRNTLRQYEGAFQAAGLLEGPADALPDEATLHAAVQAALGKPPPPQETSTVQAWEAEVRQMLTADASPKVVYDGLRLAHKDFRGSYDAIKRLCRRISRAKPPVAEDVAIPVVAAPGAEAQVDFGYIGELLDPAEGRLRKAWIFVLVLSYSRYLYADIVFDQRAETWQRLHAAAFADLGGVPHALRPDNLKAAVIRAAFATGDEAELNRSYVELARYYKFQIDPAPPRAPKKKGKVERAVSYIKHSFFKSRSFTDVHEARAGLQDWIATIANPRLHGATGRVPAEVFATVERPVLKPLPALPFAPVVWTQAKVHTDSHVQFARALYSVPWRLLGQTVAVRAVGQTVEIHGDQGRIATHERQPVGGRSTLLGHLPDERVAYATHDRLYWEARAGRIGGEVRALVAEIFDAEHVLLQLRKVQGLVSALERFPAERAVAAARRARFYQSYSVRAVKDMLRRGLESEPLPDALIPTHGALETPRFARSPAQFIPSIAEA